MLKGSREDRALRAVTEEARRQGTPAVSDHLEERLLEAISKPPAALGPRRNAASSRWTWLMPVVGLCAAAALALVFWPRSVELPRSATAVKPSSELDGDRLGPERVIVASNDVVEVRHAGRARWWLERGSRAAVIEARDVIRVRLLRGAMRAQVVPSPSPERFVVEAGDTRVAVHGTVFRVALEGFESVVDVEEGTVAVGPLHGPRGEPLFLRGPSRGRFGPRGLLQAAPVPDKKAARAPFVRRPFPEPEPSVSASAASPAETASTPRELTIGQVEAGVATVVQAIAHCFEEHTAADGDVRIRVQSSVTLTISPDGSITDVAFSPPLSPAVQACSERDARTALFAASVEGATVTRVFELSR